MAIRKHIPILCCNCGLFGHVFKQCTSPICSYGIICYKREYNPWKKTVTPKFLMVQRKDSLNYVEFLRGKYDTQDRAYLLNLFTNMTPRERSDIACKTFDILWQELWKINTCSVHQREYTDSKQKFEMLKAGYHVDGSIIDINHIVANTNCMIFEAEYGFPKGRRNMNEVDLHCAIREFVEETGMQDHQFRLLSNVKPFEESFTGSNKVRYKHVYYLAKCKDNGCDVCTMNKAQALEVQDVKWFTYSEAQGKILNQNQERKEMFSNINFTLQEFD